MNEDQFKQALADIAAGRAATTPHLSGLSHLLPEQLASFRDVWTPLPEQEKLSLIRALVRAEAETLRLEFNAIYHLGMADENPRVRRSSIEATLEDDSSWLLERLLTRIVRDVDANVRAAAATALEPFAQRAELGELSAEQALRIRETLIETIHRPGERTDVQAAALASVGYFSDESARRELQSGFDQDAFRVQALRAMGHSADPDWLDAIIGEFEADDDALRLAAVSAAGEIGDTGAVPDLINLIDDSSLPIRLAAIAALGEIGGDEAREALVYALQDEDTVVREAAEAAISELDFFDDALAT